MAEEKKIVFTEALLQQYEAHAAEVVKFNWVEEAEYFVFQTWPRVESDRQLAQNQPAIFQRLERLYALNTLLLIPSLPDKRVLDLFQKDVIWYFRDMIEHIDLWEKVRGKLVTLFYDERNSFKAEIRQSLLKNDALITEQKIERNNQTYQPSIRQWILDYTSNIGNQPVNSVKMNEYFVRSKNFQPLANREQDRVRTLITFYERTKRSSLEPEGLEERVLITDDGGRELIFNEGAFEDYDSRIKKVVKQFKAAGLIVDNPFDRPAKSTQESTAATYLSVKVTDAQAKTTVGPIASQAAEILTAYQGDSKQQQAISREQERIVKKIGSKADQLSAVFYHAVQTRNAAATVASLRLMAEHDALATFLKTDEKLKQFLSLTWEKQYGKATADEFLRQPGQPKFIKLFLQYVLQQRLGLSSSEAARLGSQIGNIFVRAGKKEYNKLAYFDVKSGKFKWFEG